MDYQGMGERGVRADVEVALWRAGVLSPEPAGGGWLPGFAEAIRYLEPMLIVVAAGTWLHNLRMLVEGLLLR